MALVDLQRHRVRRVNLLLAVKAVDRSVAGARRGPRAVAEVGSESRRGVRRALVRVAGERLEVEDTAEQCPDVGEIGGDEGGGGLSDVPECPVGAKGLVKAVEFVEDCGEDLEGGNGQRCHGFGVWYRLTVKAPSANTATSTAFLLVGSWDLRNIGMGMAIIMISDEMLRTALVMRWFVAAEH